MVLVFTLLYLRIAWLAATPFYAETAQSQSRYTLALTQGRGTIYDCNGNRLVNAESGYLAAVMPSQENFAAVASHAVKLSRQELEQLWEQGKPCVVQVDGEFDSPDTWIYQVPIRYGEDQLAQHVVGYTDSSGQGAAGVERGYESLLASEDGGFSLTFTVDAFGRGVSMEEATGKLDNSAGVVLTLDREIQQICETTGEQYLEQGAVVVMEAATGKLRGVASFPSYSTDQLAEAVADEENTPLMNRAFQAYAVGSVFKIVTAAAALEQGISPDFTHNCTGSITVDGTTFRCHHLAGHGLLDLKGALMESCNPYFIALSQQLDPTRFWQIACGLGFGCSAELGDNLITASGALPDPEELKNSGAMSNFSFGQGALTATPVQLAVMVSCVVNGGWAPSPSLVEGTTQNGTDLDTQRISPQLTQVMSQETASILKEDLLACVMEQPGQNATAPNGEYVAGGKTGTAQTGQMNENGEEYNNGWFAGFFNAGGTDYVVVVLSQQAESGNADAAPVFRQIALEMTAKYQTQA